MKIGTRAPLPEFENNTVGNWKSGGLIECTNVNAENEEVNSYSFKAPDGTGFDFKPGQHVSILLPLTSGEEYRTFTICSSPTRRDEIMLTVKVNRPDGATAWMRDNIKVGNTFTAVGPTGLFNLIDYPCEKLLLISAGSGITPMMSMLRWLSDRQDDLDVTFIHYAKNSDEYLFSEELVKIASDYDPLAFHQVSTHREDTEIYGLPTSEQLAALMNVTDHQVFCCGPSGFMDAIKDILLKGGLNPDHYHQESFGTDVTEPEAVDENAETITITFKDKTFNAKRGETLLSVLTKNKIVVPTRCKSGMCGTCQMKLISGTVDMKHQGGLSEQQIDEGYILACCSTLNDNISIL
ncbi:MAG: iron-sulfur cluster-binding domain-containing protein [Kordiimonadaceae bacterium]|mgnify:CR=1 FL=1|jgi:ferredoxin-NADP reductase|nr:iron-sulfur cluster-binding domain-containing protein [Kordiimonadaceae bacterium]